ncbi:MAG: tRNA 2-thiouridine(34) synthase MnmA [Candidatus Aureabacteria bacterium]|nr:tRNA 2-thiouridine(34) synthase MnmA [Candidatus Auribacterota bacterium]
MKFIVGMSGGVDSAVAALLLKEQGHQVTGITLKLWAAGRGATVESQNIRSARAVCEQIQIEHRVIDAEDVFRDRIISYFCREYQRGRTPNPCIVCNPEIKFSTLLRYADEIGADLITTGHYARLEKGDGRILLMRGVDRSKDQAYFLYRLTQQILRRTIFPLGEHHKRDVRRIAATHGLTVQDRPESQEICFIPDDDYRSFLRETLGDSITQGDIIDARGNRIGTHSGIEFFTVGQRSGLSLNSKTRQYVLSIDSERDTITVGGIDDLALHEMRVSDINWISFDSPPASFRALVKIRYNHPGVMSTVEPAADCTALVKFDAPQKAVTPGQAAVFYDGDRVIGGGWID